MARSVRPRIFSPFVYARRAFVYRGVLGGSHALDGGRRYVLGGSHDPPDGWSQGDDRGQRSAQPRDSSSTIRTIRPPTRRERKAARRAPPLNRTSRAGVFARGRARMVAP